MIGKTLSHYKILERIGAGGMGVVYRAHDARLGRDVALKLLPAETLGSESARRQLENEARTASALNHPHICTIHDVGEAEGQFFVAMEYVAGKPLAQLIPAGGLPEEQVMRYGMQIADALAHAQERGIVHRDLKSANVVITPEGRAKVLDFGLAQRVRKEELEEVTRSKVSIEASRGIAGTLAYMAPENLRGETADARSDIWALGVVLHEMAAGELPFQGATGFELSAAILREPPRPLPERVPAGLRGVIQRCLAKEPAQRYQRAGEVRAALEAIGSSTRLTPLAQAPEPHSTFWRSAIIASAGVLALAAVLLAFNVGGVRERLLGRTTAPQIESIAVLPLANLSGDPSQEYFADGMTEALISNLAQIRALRVISRTSVMRYRNSQKTVPEIARELHVDAVVEGSVQKAGERVRITAQLIRAATDTHLWANEYERDLRDVLTLQSEVARAIAGEIKVQLTPQEQTRLASTRPVNPEAHEAYLRGRYEWNKFTKEGFLQAKAYFEQAIQIDSRYALPYAGLAETYVQLASRAMPPTVAMPKAKQAALKALELDPNLAEAHIALALVVTYYEWNWAEAEKEFKLAIELNSGYSHVHGVYAHHLAARGQFEKALAEWGRAKEIDPLSNNCVEVRLLSYAHRFAQAIEVYRKLLERDPEAASSCFWVVTAYVKERTADQAIVQAQKIADRLPYETLAMATLGRAYWAAGKKQEAQALLTSLLALAKKQYVSPFNIAVLYAGMEDRSRTMEWLEKAAQERAGLLVYLNVDPWFDDLRGDPRFQDLLRRMNFPR
jgi:serine/threonine protein kinase/Tfp pilus assembly protein PilF